MYFNLGILRIKHCTKLKGNVLNVCDKHCVLKSNGMVWRC